MFAFLTKSISNKTKLFDVLLRLITNSDLQFEQQNQSHSIIERCGSVLYTLTYEYMLKLNNMVRITEVTHANPDDAKFKKDLRRYALSETLSLLYLLHDALIESGHQSSLKIRSRYGRQTRGDISALSVNIQAKVKNAFPATNMTSTINELALVRVRKSVALLNMGGKIRKRKSKVENEHQVKAHKIKKKVQNIILFTLDCSHILYRSPLVKQN